MDAGMAMLARCGLSLAGAAGSPRFLRGAVAGLSARLFLAPIARGPVRLDQ